MSGDAIDGISLALLSTDGENLIERGAARFFPYSRDLKIFIRRALKAAQEGRDGAADIGKASGEITQAHAVAVSEFLEMQNMKRTSIDVIGFHGHTLVHHPRANAESLGRSWRIGEGKALAEETKIDVVTNFHDADIAAGGEGDPLAAPYLAALVRELEPDGDVAVLDVGDAAKICVIPFGGGDADLLCFDCGPGLALIERWMALKTGDPASDAEAAARSGQVHSDLLRLALLNPYLRRKPPKKIAGTDFKLDPMLHLSAADGAASLTALIGACVRSGLSHLDRAPCDWVVIGRGRRNRAVMEALGKAIDGEFHDADSLGWNADALVAESIAYLAVRSLRKIPFSFPRTTRVPHPLGGGIHHRAPV